MIKNIILIIAILLFLTNCAVMNTSMTETAKTLKPGKVKIAVEYGSGIDMASTVFLEEDKLDIFDSKKLKRSTNLGLKFGRGILEGFEINGKIWLGSGGFGTRLYTKHRLNGPGKRTNFAILPGFNFVTSEADLFYNTEDIKVPRISAYGLEFPFLVSHRFNPHITIYGAFRYSVDKIFVQHKAIKTEDEFTLNRFGFLSGISLRFGELYFRPEWGFEGAETKYGDFTYMPNFSMGFGLEF